MKEKQSTMSCLDCGKALKGGFGVGKEPFKAFRCADCSIANVEESSRVFALEKLAAAVKEAWAFYGDGYYVRKRHRDEVSGWLRVLESRK